MNKRGLDHAFHGLGHGVGDFLSKKSTIFPESVENLRACGLTAGPGGRSLRRMLREVLKSKLHRAMITDADVDYEGSIEIPLDLMEAADLWAGEKVLVASITTGARLETYVLEGKAGTGTILINGGAAHLIKAGERVTIMAFCLSETPVKPTILLLDEKNLVVRGAR